MFAIRVHGAREVDRAIEVLTGAYSKRMMTLTIKEALKPFLKAARKAVPMDTKALRRSIRSRVGRRLRTMVIVRAGPGHEQFWGMFQEFGTDHHSAQPWMAPAWKQTKDEILEDLVGAFARVMNRIAKRINRKIKTGKKFSRMEERLLGI